MVRFNSSLTVKVETLLDSVVENAYEDLNSMEACAGIHNNYDAAVVARKNHYGHHPPKGGYAPPRVWVDMATNGISAESRLAAIVKGRIQSAAMRNVKNISFISREGKQVVSRSDVRTRPFGVSQSGARSVLQALATEMANNQRNFIRSGAVTPDNQESTRKRKGMNNPPMIWSRNMVKNIRGWVQDSETGAEIMAKYINERDDEE